MGGPARPQRHRAVLPLPGPSSPTGSPRRQCPCLFQGVLPEPCRGDQGAQDRVGPVGRRPSDRSSRRLWGKQEAGCEPGWGQPRTRTLGVPSPSFPEAPKLSLIPHQVRKEKRSSGKRSLGSETEPGVSGSGPFLFVPPRGWGWCRGGRGLGRGEGSHRHSPGPGGPGPASARCSADTWWGTGNSGGAACVSQAWGGTWPLFTSDHSLSGPCTPLLRQP